MKENEDAALQAACNRWTWDEKAVSAIAFGSILAMLFGVI